MAWLFILFALVMVRPAPCWGQSNPAWYQLALQWPNTYCATHHCRTPIPQRFTIHGVFGMDQYDQPLPCDENARPMTPIEKQSLIQKQSLITDLKIHWPNLKFGSDNMRFWDCEFAKHASCFPILLPPEHFFQNAIDLKHFLDQQMMTIRFRPGVIHSAHGDPTLAVLRKYGFIPGGVFNPSRIVSVFNRAFDHSIAVQVKCDPGNRHLILEIHFCIYPNWTAKPCNPTSIDCDQYVSFHTNPPRVFNSSTPIASAPAAFSDSECDGSD